MLLAFCEHCTVLRHFQIMVHLDPGIALTIRIGSYRIYQVFFTNVEAGFEEISPLINKVLV